MSKNTVKRLFSAVLAVVMLVSVTPLVKAGARPTIYDPENNPEEWAKFVTMFTEKANSIKKDTPYCVVSNESGLAENGIKVEYDGDGNAYDEEVDAKKRLLSDGRITVYLVCFFYCIIFFGKRKCKIGNFFQKRKKIRFLSLF